MAEFTGTGLSCYRGRRMVFHGLDFSIAESEMLHLVGPNGSGKSTLLRVMAGLLPVTEGELRWDGKLLAEDRDGHRGRLLYVGHAEAVKGALSVTENLEFWCKMAGGGDVATGLAHYNLDAFAQMPARFLSAGQRRRLNLARLAAIPVQLWLLDEPAASLDTVSKDILEHAIEAHMASGGSVVMASHARDLSQGRVLALDQFAGKGADLGEAVL